MTRHWEPGTQYNYGDVVEYQGQHYKIIQAHRSQVCITSFVRSPVLIILG